MNEHYSAAASSTSGSPGETAGSGSEREGGTTSQSDPLGVKREGSDEPDDERDQLEDDSLDSKAAPRPSSSSAAAAAEASNTPVVEALVSMHSTGAKNANAQFVHKLFA